MSMLGASSIVYLQVDLSVKKRVRQGATEVTDDGNLAIVEVVSKQQRSMSVLGASSIAYLQVDLSVKKRVRQGATEVTDDGNLAIVEVVSE